MTPAETLRAARALIEKPEAWCQHSYYRYDGAMGIITSRCAIGAIRGAAGGRSNVENEAEIVLQRALNGLDVMKWNDKPRRQHRTVLAAFDRAIALAEKDEAA